MAFNPLLLLAGAGASAGLWWYKKKHPTIATEGTYTLLPGVPYHIVVRLYGILSAQMQAEQRTAANQKLAADGVTGPIAFSTALKAPVWYEPGMTGVGSVLVEFNMTFKAPTPLGIGSTYLAMGSVESIQRLDGKAL